MAHQPGHLGYALRLRQEARRTLAQRFRRKAQQRLPLAQAEARISAHLPGQVMKSMIQHRQRDRLARPAHRREAGGGIAGSAAAAADTAFEGHIIIAALPGGRVRRCPHPVLEQANMRNNVVVIVHAVRRHHAPLVLIRKQVDQVEQRGRPMGYRNG
ncbi:hypothetical protein D3C73_930080 [compost metagenome]